MQMSDEKTMTPSTTFGVTSTTGGTRPIAVVAPMCHHPSAAPIVTSTTHRPCNDPAAGADVAGVLPPAQEAGTTFVKDLTVPSGGAAASNSIREGPSKSQVTTRIRSVPTLRTAPFTNSPQPSTVLRTSMLGTDTSLLGTPVQGTSQFGTPVQGAALLETPVQGTSLLGAPVQGISLLGTSSLDFPCSETSPTWFGSDSGASSGDCCQIDTITIRDRRSVLGHPCASAAAAAGKTSGVDLVSGLTASLQRFLLDSSRTQGQCPDVILRETTTPSSVSTTPSSQLAAPHLVPSLKEPDDLSGSVDECNFYYGRMSNTEAKSRLHRCSVGTFLLRDSSDARFRYSLSVKTARGTTSIRIVGGTSSSTSGQFRLDSDPHQESRMPGFRWILSLVEHYFLSAAASSSVKPSSSTEKGGHHHHRQRGQCVLLESSGRYDTPMLLRKPLEVSPAPLAHLCRRTLNNLVPFPPSVEHRRKLIDALTVIGADGHRRKSVEEYMMRYPFRV